MQLFFYFKAFIQFIQTYFITYYVIFEVLLLYENLLYFYYGNEFSDLIVMIFIGLLLINFIRSECDIFCKSDTNLVINEDIYLVERSRVTNVSWYYLHFGPLCSKNTSFL